MSQDDEFIFNEEDFRVDDKDLEKLDREFLKSNQEQLLDSQTCDDNDAYNFWFLIIILIFFIFFLSMGVVFLVRSRRQRMELVRVGYRY